MIKDPTIEFQPLEEIIAFQEEKLQSALQYLKAHSPFYQKLFQEEQIEIEAIKTIEQLQLIPFTEKSALHEHNKEFLCTPKERIIDYITTSGTSGDPVTFAMSDRDLERLAYNEAISFMGTGSKPGDIFQLMTTIDKRFIMD